MKATRRKGLDKSHSRDEPVVCVTQNGKRTKAAKLVELFMIDEEKKAPWPVFKCVENILIYGAAFPRKTEILRKKSSFQRRRNTGRVK